MPDKNPNPPSFYERLRGKRTSNIELPSEGSVDPNLPPSPRQQLEKAAKNYRDLNKSAAMQGLYDAAGIKK